MEKFKVNDVVYFKSYASVIPRVILEIDDTLKNPIKLATVGRSKMWTRCRKEQLTHTPPPALHCEDI